MSKGAITTEKVVWCGVCAHWDRQPAAADRVAKWRRAGWRRTEKHGWVCPTCAPGHAVLREKRRRP